MQIMAPFWFAAVLSLITVLASLGGYRSGGSETAGLIPFLCFFPLAIMFVCQAQRQAVGYIRALEQRVEELEEKAG
jgi:hypothetical protein